MKKPKKLQNILNKTYLLTNLKISWYLDNYLPITAITKYLKNKNRLKWGSNADPSPIFRTIKSEGRNVQKGGRTPKPSANHMLYNDNTGEINCDSKKL